MKQKGFTLIELIIVVAIIAILAGAIFVALDPAKRFQDSRNTRRASDATTIIEAVLTHQADNDGVLVSGIDSTLRMLGTNLSGCDVTCGTTGGEETGTTNVALNEVSSASSSYSSYYSPANVNDGNNNNFWLNNYSQGADGQWWQVDLGQEYSVNRAEVRWYDSAGNYNCNQFTIRGSNNGSDFTTVHGPINTSGDSQEATYDFNSASYRYWRFMCDDAVNNYFYVLREVRLFEALESGETTDSACLDLSTPLDGYLGVIPKDPSLGSDEKTYYGIKALSPAGVKVVACSPEGNETIEIIR